MGAVGLAAYGLQRLPGPELYASPVKIRDKTTGEAFRTYATDSFLVSKGAFSNALVASFIVGANAKGLIDDLDAWSISDAGPPPLLYACTTESGAAFLRFQTLGSAGAESLAREWVAARNTFAC